MITLKQQLPEKIFRLLDRLVKDNEEVFGAAVALEPGAFGFSRVHTAPYVYRAWNQPVRDNLAQHATAYTVQDWYSLPKMLGRPVWSEPYRSDAGQTHRHGHGAGSGGRSRTSAAPGWRAPLAATGSAASGR